MKIDVDALKKILIEKEMTLKELSQQTGLSTITLTSILKNGESRNFKTLGKLFNGLKINPADVISNN